MRTEIDAKITSERYTRASAPTSEQKTGQPGEVGQTAISYLCDQCAEFRGRIYKLEQDLAALQQAQAGYLTHAKGLPPIE